MYRKFRLAVLSILYRIPLTRAWAYERLPRHRSGYQKHWVAEEGKRQRATLKARQDVTAQRFFPTPRKLVRTILAHHPASVLDIGCGYGRFLEITSKYFNVQGCDIAPDLLAQVTPELRGRVFELDLVRPPMGWVEAHKDAWDVSYAWAVFMYFIDDRESMLQAMQHADMVTAHRVIVWDWKHVCDYMRETYPSSKFEYHTIPLIMC